MQKILITSALPYVNGVPHLGHMVGCLLPSDIYARFMRMMGHEVLYICGTDEHGTPSEVGAISEGMDIYDYCTKYHNMHKQTYKDFNLSFDYLGRTSSEENKESTYHIFEKLDKNGYISEKSIKQLYSIDDKRYLPDRYVIGTCPYCKYESARGDQCEKCTKVLDPTDLINPRSAISGSQDIEIRETKHLFLDLPKIEKPLSEWVATKEHKWGDVAYSIAKKWLKEGLQERGITRDLKWGFPVNKSGYEDKVFYVWFDAPIGYIGITKEWEKQNPKNRNWKDWWLDAKDVKYVQFMGKDNVPFHSITFPATLIGTGENWTLVDYLKGMNFLNFEGKKFSKSEKRGVFAEDAVKEFPADYWRYWLIANAPENDDTTFTFELFVGAINKDLNGVLGNFVSRVMKMTASKLGEFVPEKTEYTVIENELIKELESTYCNYIKYMEELEFRKALAELRAFWVAGNNYITVAEPWNVIKEDEKRAGGILYNCFNLIRLFAILSYPIMPKTSEKMMRKLGLNIADTTCIKNLDIKEEMQKISSGSKFEVGEALFERILPEKVVELKEKYNGEENKNVYF